MDDATGLLMFCEMIRSNVDAKLAPLFSRIAELEKQLEKAETVVPVGEIEDIVDNRLEEYVRTSDLAAPREVLSVGIDDTKDNVEGDLVISEGGLWRCKFEDGKPAWDCLIDGVKDITLEHDGERTIKTIVTLSSGKTTEKEATLPAMIYRGVHQDGETYVKGDSVTRKGSVWCCAVETTDSAPGDENSDWQLAVKRGRDGKDAN